MAREDGGGRWQTADAADGRFKQMGQMADGRRQMAGGGKGVAGGRWQMAGGSRRQMADRMTDGRWQVAGRWQMAWQMADGRT
jgi:hypothetical protein